MQRWGWLKDRLFAKGPDELAGVRGFAVRVGRLFYLTVSHFRRDHGFECAASLTFASIISLIPLIVLFFGFAALLGGSDRVVDFVAEKVVAATAPGLEGEVRENLKGISHNVFQAGPAGLVNLTAVVGLLIIALGIFLTAERVFNRIWDVRGRRSILQKVTAFWVILTTSPFLIVVSIWVGELLVPAGGQIRSLTETHWALEALYQFVAPVSIGFFAFTLMYLFLPATRVRVTSAALGGVLTAALWQVSKRGFLIYLERAGEVTVFYKQLSFVPLFLMWLYITWIVILVGGHLSYCHQNLEALSRPRRQGDKTGRFSRVFLGLFLLQRIVGDFSRGQTLSSTEDVAGEIGTTTELLEQVAASLVDVGVLAAVDDADGVFTLARDPHGVVLRDVVDRLRRDEFPAESALLGLDEVEAGILRLPHRERGEILRSTLVASHEAALGSFGERSVAYLAELSAEESTAEPSGDRSDAGPL